MQNSAFHPNHLHKRTALIVDGTVCCRSLGASIAKRPSRIVKSKVVTP